MAKQKPRGRRKKPAPIAKWLWVVTALFIIGLITFLLYITRSTPIEKTSPYPVKSTPPQGSTKPKPKFEFYERLPNKQPPPPAVIQQQPKSEQTKPTAPVSNTFLLEVGIFNKFDEADQLKAELTLLGFPVMMQSFNTDGNLQFRVLCGPYTDKSTALAAQNDLKSYQVSSKLVAE